MNSETLACHYTGGEGERVCDIFRQAVAAIGRADVASLSVERHSPTQARAVASDRTGREILALDFDVMDAELDETKWRDFARMFAAELKTD